MNKRCCLCCLACEFAFVGNGFTGCKYEGDCDHQLPKNNRSFIGHYYYHGPVPESVCPYCHLPIKDCRGHTIC